MSHTLAVGGDGTPAAGEPAREANLLGTVSLAVSERVDGAVELAAGHGGAAPAALSALATYLDGSSIDALRRALGLTHSAAVRLADRLSQTGLVKRAPGLDGRSVSIQLTDDGSTVAARIQAAREASLLEILAPLSQAERAELTRLHEKLLEGVVDGREAARHVCRLCDAHACGHAEGRCPVTRAADQAEAAVG